MNGPLSREAVTRDIEAHDHAALLSCYHCGEQVPPGADFSLEIDGLPRPMCCPGCRAVASLIADSGLTRFYDQRTAYSERPEDQSTPANEDSFAIYDDRELLAQFSQTAETGDLDARLLIGGVSCAACTWLIETSLLRLDGVSAASLNLAQARLDLRFDPGKIKASELFARITALGYRVQPWHSSAQRDQAQAEYRRDLRRLAVAGIGMMQVGMFAIALHAGDIQGIAREYEQLLRLVSLLVTGFIVLFSAREFFSSAWRHLRNGALVMDLPVALAIGIAYGASAVATLRGGGDVYFDSVVMFTFLLLLARFIEKRLRLRDTLAWQDAEQALPDAVQVRLDARWQQIPRRAVVAGQRILLRAGDTIPVDGVVLSGESAVREDSFSGEALPRSVGPGDGVFAGTLNREASLEMESSGAYADSRLAALQRSIENARLGKPAIARLAVSSARRSGASSIAAPR
ncbi:MAG: heavy metal translocating P-type ATPase metal-binding domain-containing protein, partial [Pseudomonadota bacterium]